MKINNKALASTLLIGVLALFSPLNTSSSSGLAVQAIQMNIGLDSTSKSHSMIQDESDDEDKKTQSLAQKDEKEKKGEEKKEDKKEEDKKDDDKKEEDDGVVAFNPKKSIKKTMGQYKGDFGQELFAELLTREDLSHLLYSDIEACMQLLVKDFPDIMSMTSIGKTWQDREIKVLKLDARE